MHIDADLFGPEAIATETREFNKQLAEMLAAAPSITTMEPHEVRDLRRQGQGVFGPLVVSERARTSTVPGPDGDIPIRVLAGDRVDAVYLHIHGGGFVLGSEDMQDPMHDAMADESGVAVVSVGYRLAPEHPYPAGADDCEAAAVWLLENIEEEFGTETMLIGGESAGAHLAVTTLVRMRDRHEFTGFAGANLVYGGYTVEYTPSTRNWDRGNLILDQDIIDWFHRHTFATNVDPADPDAAPLYADLGGLATALFTVGTLDPLLDNTLMMAARWVAAGNQAELAVYPGGIHAFDVFPEELAIARDARAYMHGWVRDIVAMG